MGLFRKMTSLSTLGAVDFRSDKERIASYTKATKKQAKQQTGIMRQQQGEAKRAAERQHWAEVYAQPQWQPQPPPIAGPPPGFYNDPQGLPVVRWWDGQQWTGMTQPLPHALP